MTSDYNLTYRICQKSDMPQALICVRIQAKLVALPRGAMGLSAVFPDHTHLLFWA